MVTKISLNGAYTLYRYEGGRKIETLSAAVPCNAETARAACGDLYRAGAECAKELELSDWYFTRAFTARKARDGERIFLEFEGVDTFFSCFINGNKAGEGKNALIFHRFDVTERIRDGENTVEVRIFSTLKKAFGYENSPVAVPCLPENAESLNIRKPAYQFGWDIFPRVLSAGITGDVFLVYESGVNIKRLQVSTQYVTDAGAGLQIFYDIDMPPEDYGKYALKISFSCKDSVFGCAIPVGFRSGVKYLFLDKQPYLWWANGMGEQNLYRVQAELCLKDRPIDSRSFSFGIRYLELKRQPFAGEKDAFCFYLNGKAVKCTGANVVPPDVLTSRIPEKLPALVAALKESNANMARVWGGGCYFGEAFFDLCDKAGILVWQDFMLACHSYPVSEELENALFAEAEQIVCRYANHASLALYCGSNETDWPYYCVGLDPNRDAYTRKIFPQAVFKNDPNRVYLPSTPYFSEAYVKAYGNKFLIDLPAIEENRKSLPDEHYWWRRRDFRSFSAVLHNFVSEIGYSGMPSSRTIASFAGDRFDVSSPLMKARDYSTEGDFLYGIGYYFTDAPDCAEEIVLASQIYQAEAYKYLVEKTRLSEKLTGVLLWTFNEGWPCFTSGVVDYYGDKKLAFYYVKNAQRPLQFIFCAENGRVSGFFVNGTLREIECRVKIYDGEDRLLAETVCAVPPQSVKKAAADLRGKGFLLSELTAEGETAYNHVALCEKYSFAHYKAFLDKYRGKLFGI